MIRRIRIWWYFQRGMMCRFMGHRLVKRGWYEASTQLFTRVLQLQPSHMEALISRGLIYWRELQLSERAVADFTGALTLAPDRADIMFYRGMAHQQNGNYHAAAVDLNAAITLAPRAIWRHNAQNQLMLIQAILEELPDRLNTPQSLLLSGE